MFFFHSALESLLKHKTLVRGLSIALVFFFFGKRLPNMVGKKQPVNQLPDSQFFPSLRQFEARGSLPHVIFVKTTIIDTMKFS